MSEVDRSQWVVTLQGKQYPTWPLVLDELHKRDLVAIACELIQIPTRENEHTAIVKARVTLGREESERRVFIEYGDASPANTSSRIASALIRMAACVPLSSEILTRSGFKRYDALAAGEDVLAYDCQTDSCRWTPLRGVSVYREAYPTVRVSSRSCSFVCTPDHSWVVTGQKSPQCLRDVRPRLVKLHNFRTAQHIIQAAPAEGGDSPLSPREAAILGWLATDGNVRECTVTGKYGTFGPYLRATIHQSKDRYLSVIRELLGDDATELTEAPKARDFGPYGGRLSECRQSYRWNLRARFLRQLYRSAGIERLEELPALVLRLSAPARAAMLEAMLQAEGHHKGGTRWEFYQRKPWVMEAFVLLATLEGRALGAGSSKGVRWDKRALRNRRYLTVEYLQISQETDQPVWCPTTDYGTWVMRQDGMVTITGNTRAKGRAGRDACNIGMTLLEELPEDEAKAAALGAHRGNGGAARVPDRSGERAAVLPTDMAIKHGPVCEVCQSPLSANLYRSAMKHFQRPLCEAHGREHLQQLRAEAERPGTMVGSDG